MIIEPKPGKAEIRILTFLIFAFSIVFICGFKNANGDTGYQSFMQDKFSASTDPGYQLFLQNKFSSARPFSISNPAGKKLARNKTASVKSSESNKIAASGKVNPASNPNNKKSGQNKADSLKSSGGNNAGESGYQLFLENKLPPSKPAEKNKVAASTKNVDRIVKSIDVYYENDYFHYGEYQTNLPGIASSTSPVGSYVDGEHASMRGWGISFQDLISEQIPIWFKANYSYLSGSSNYDKPDTNDISHSTDMTRYGFRIGYLFHVTDRIALIPNFGYQWVNWDRSLPFSGLNSDYYHLNYYMIGVKGYYIPPVFDNNLWIEGEGYYLNDINDTVDEGSNSVEYLQPDPIVEIVSPYNHDYVMAPRAGYILGAKVGYTVYRYNNISINPYIGFRFAQNAMGRSNIDTCYDYLGNVGECFEPTDQYNQIFLQLGVKLGF